MHKKAAIQVDNPRSKHQKKRRNVSKTPTFFDNIEIDQNLLKQFPMLNIKERCPSQIELSRMKQELTNDLKAVTSNKFYSYMRNYKYFKDQVLMPQSEQVWDVEDGPMNGGGDNIFVQAQKSQNRDVLNEIRGIRSMFAGKGQQHIQQNLKQRVVEEVNSHLQRQFKIDSIMRSRYDEKANKMLFGAKIEGNPLKGDNHRNQDEISFEHSQQKISHIVFKNKNVHVLKTDDDDSEEDEPNFSPTTSSIHKSQTLNNRDQFTINVSQFSPKKDEQLNDHQNHTQAINNRRQTLKNFSILPHAVSPPPPQTKFTLLDFTRNSGNIKEILQAVSPKRLTSPQIGSPMTVQSEPDTQILRFKQVGASLKMVQHESVFKGLQKQQQQQQSSPQVSKINSSDNILGHHSKSTFSIKPSSTKKLTLSKQSSAQHPQSDKRADNNTLEFNAKTIMARTQVSKPLQHLKKISQAQAKDNPVLQNLDISKNVFMKQRQKIQLSLKPSLNLHENSDSPQKSSLISSGKYEYEDLRSSVAKRKMKSSLDAIQNIRDKESQYFEMYDFMRELENDNNQYQKILKSTHDENDDGKLSIELVTDMLIAEKRQQDQIELQREQELLSSQNTAFSGFTSTNSTNQLRNLTKQNSIKTISQMIHNKRISSTTVNTSTAQTSIENSKRKKPMKPATINSRNTSIYPISKTLNSEMSSQQEKVDFLSQFDPLNKNGKQTTFSLLRGNTQVENLKLKMIKKSSSEQSFKAKWQLIEKLNQLRDDNQSQLLKQQTIMDMQRARKAIQTVIEDNSSDEDEKQYQEQKQKIKRDIMMSHSFHKNLTLKRFGTKKL